MNLCPVGVKGEIMVAGVGVGRGYLGDEERTRRAFTEDPFRAERGVRLYRTGDVGRYLDDGRLEFAGRRDYQVKVRGYRIELEEIESVVTQHPSAREAMVIVKKDAGGDDYLACYLTAEGEFDAEALRAFLAAKLPHYMIPAHFRALDSLPLNENGKHDRKALAALTDDDVLASASGVGPYVAPRDEVEERLARIWQDVLRVERVGVKDDFFALGGDSFKAIRVVSNFGRGFLVPDLFNHPTVEGLADFMRRSGGSLSLLYELTPKGGRKKMAVVTVPHSAGDPLGYTRTAEALTALSDEYRLLSVALPRREPEPGETYAQVLRQLAGQVVEEIRKLDMPVIIYGQSNGTGLALELARWMERERLPLRALVMGGALLRLSIDPRTLESDTRSDEAIVQFVSGLGSSLIPEDPADLAIFTRNFRYDSLIAVNAYYNALRDMKKTSFQRLEAPLFSVTGDVDPLTRNYQTRWRDWYRIARRVELVVFEGVGHYLLRDRPEEVARVLHRVGEGDYVAPEAPAPEAAGVLGRLKSMLPRLGRD
jgi:surfactin synthase thioesterase subunit